MTPHDTPHPEWARLMARLAAFLDEAEAAMASAQPQQLVQASGSWAQLCRDLRRLPDTQWPSQAVRVDLLSKAAMRVASLQQAAGRAQARITRELDMLSQPAPTPLGEAEAQRPSMMAGPGTYDATGGRAGAIRTAGTYA